MDSQNAYIQIDIKIMNVIKVEYEKDCLYFD